jgi:phosphohistidine phosphatase
MELYFLRHGKTVPRSEWTSDSGARPLSDDSVVAMAHEAWVLARLGVKPDLILTSPVERALQTAGIMASGLGLGDRLRTEPSLAPGFGMKQLRHLLRTHRDAASIMLVGHGPDFGTVVRKLTGGHAILSKGGLAHVHFAARKSTSAELVCLLQGRELVRLGLINAPAPEGTPHEGDGEPTGDGAGAQA